MNVVIFLGLIFCVILAVLLWPSKKREEERRQNAVNEFNKSKLTESAIEGIELGLKRVQKKRSIDAERRDGSSSSSSGSYHNCGHSCSSHSCSSSSSCGGGGD